MATRVSSPVFVGRGPELDRLERALAAAAEGEPRLVLVAGDAGVGKTRLVAELADGARASGALVAAGCCLPVGANGLPLAAVVEALRRLYRELGPSRFEALAGTARIELARLVPDLAAGTSVPAERLTEGWAQLRLFEQLHAFLGRLGRQATVVWVIEDLHWSDEATRGLVTFLAHNLVDERVLLVATYRTDDLHRGHPLMPVLAELRRAPHVNVIALERFDADELAEQIGAILGHAPDASFLAEIEERSEGNAYLAEELVAAGPSATIPADVEDVLLARIGRLTPLAATVLRVAAASGPRIDLRVLGTVAGSLGHDASAALLELVDEHVLVRLDPEREVYAFRHALLQEAVYAQLLPAERSEYHEAFARELSCSPHAEDASVAARIAYHSEAADDLPHALVASVDAGRAAARISAFGDAQRLFERALVLWQRVPEISRRATGVDRLTLLEMAAAAAAQAGSYARAVVHLCEAAALVDEERDPVRAGLIRERLARWRFNAGELPSIPIADAREAVRLVPPEPPSAARAAVLAGLARTLFVTDEVPLMKEAAEVAREAVKVASAVGATEAEIDARTTLSSLGEIFEPPVPFARLIAGLRDARDMAFATGDDYGALRAWGNLVGTLALGCELDECIAEAEDAVRWAGDHGLSRAGGAMIAVSGCFALYELGRWGAAEAMADACRAGPVREPDAINLQVVLIRLEIGRGEIARAKRRLEALRAPDAPRYRTSYSAGTGSLAAELALATHDLLEARRLSAGALDSWRRLGPDGALELSIVLWTALRIVADAGERARARGGREELDDAIADGEAIWADALRLPVTARATLPELRRRVSAISALCEAERARLRGDAATELWAQAAARCAEANQRYLLPYLWYREAEARIAEKGDRGATAGLLRDAHAAALAMAQRPVQTDIEMLAKRARLGLGETDAAGSGPAARRDPFDLTPRERTVLSLVAAGRTNRQIASELFISEKTAGVHVSNILGKLGASGRTEAAAIAHRLGLVQD